MIIPRPVLAVLLVWLMIAVACGGSSETPRAGSPAAGTTAAATVAPVPGSAPSTSASSAAVPVLTDNPVIVARDNVFVPAELRVPAGREVRLTLRNEGQALHDWQVLRAANPDGSAIKTPLIGASALATVAFTLTAAGSYAFYCEVHPVEMRGMLIVQ